MFKKFLSRLLNKYFVKKAFFQKMLITYSAIILACTLIVSVALTLMLRQPLANSVSSTQQALLEQVRFTADMYIVNQMNTIMNQYFMGYASDSDWSYFFSEETSDAPNLLRLLQVSKKLTALRNNYVFLDSVAVYNYHTAIAVSSSQGVMLPETRGENQTFSGIDYDKIREFEQSSLNSVWVAPSENTKFYPDEKVLTLIASIPLTNRGKTDKGCVVFNINMNKMIGFIDDIFEDENINIFAVDRDNHLMISNNYDEQIHQIQQIAQVITEQNSGSTVYENSSVLWLRSEANDWVYIVFWPMDTIYAGVQSAIKRALLAVVLILAVTFFLIYIVTYRLNAPLQRLLGRVPAKLLADEAGDEFYSIDKMLEDLTTKVTEFEKNFVDNKGLIESQVVFDILNGSVMETEEIYAMLKLIDVDFYYRNYALIFTEINDGVLERLNYKQKEYLYLDTMQDLKKYWSRLGECISARYDNYIISILATDIDDYIKHSAPEVSGNINFGLCKPAADIRSLSVSFQLLSRMMSYKFIYGFGNVFTYLDIEQYEASKEELSETWFSDMESALKQNRIDSVKTMLRDMVDELKTCGSSYDYVQGVLGQILFLICSIAREQNISGDQLSKNELFAEFNKAKSLDDFLDWIDHILSIYNANIEKRDGSIKTDFMNKILEYIDHNIDKTLSQKSVAEHFGISIGYLSRIFSNDLNIKFATYVSTKKFEFAAKMLVEEVGLSVSQIAEKVGYYNMPYFNQQFKKKFGMSPLKYRKKNLNQ